MAANKVRKDGTRLLSTDKADNPKLYARRLADNTESLYLEYYLGYTKGVNSAGKEVNKVSRRKEALDYTLYVNPTTPQQREQNKVVLELAKRIRFEAQQKLLEDKNGFQLSRKKVDVLSELRQYVEKSKGSSTYRMKCSVMNHFLDFLESSKKYNRYSKQLKAENISREMMEDFCHYERARSKTAQSAARLFNWIKSFFKSLVDADLIRKNPCSGIRIGTDSKVIAKDILSEEEVKLLAETECSNSAVKRAFLFSTISGMRFCDVRQLRFENIDYKNKLVRYTQAKTDGHSSNSSVIVPIREEDLKTIVGSRPKDKKELVFNLPKYRVCLSILKQWTQKAGIEKYITWHCARHTFGTLIIRKGADITTAAKLLGHSSITMTQKYTRVVDDQKQRAIESLPKLF